MGRKPTREEKVKLRLERGSRFLAEIVAEELRKKFEFPYVVLTWREINENLFRALELERTVFFILMSVLIGVATFNILASLIMMILSKQGEVAILRALGLPWRQLRKIFLFEGLLIGCVGLVVGLGLGLSALGVLHFWKPIPLAEEIYFIRQVPVEFAWSHIVLVASATLVLIFIGCQLTLRRLSTLPVVRSLMEAA